MSIGTNNKSSNFIGKIMRKDICFHRLLCLCKPNDILVPVLVFNQLSKVSKIQNYEKGLKPKRERKHSKLEIQCSTTLEVRFKVCSYLLSDLQSFVLFRLFGWKSIDCSYSHYLLFFCYYYTSFGVNFNNPQKHHNCDDSFILTRKKLVFIQMHYMAYTVVYIKR